MTCKTEVSIDVFRYIQKKKQNGISEEINTNLEENENLKDSGLCTKKDGMAIKWYREIVGQILEESF